MPKRRTRNNIPLARSNTDVPIIRPRQDDILIEGDWFSASPSVTPWMTMSPTPTATPTITPTQTPSITPTPTITPTLTPTIVPSPSAVPVICSNTILLVPFNGVDMGTSFPDKSGKGRTLTGNSVTTRTAQSKFNGSSAFFAGGSSYIDTDTGGRNSWADFTNQNFTIEGWVKLTQTNVQHSCLISYGRADWNGYGAFPLSEHMWSINYNASSASDGKVEFCLSNIDGLLGTNQMMKTIANIVTGNWIHLAVVRNSGDWAIYVNGVKSGERTGVTANQVGSFTNSTLGMRFGNNHVGTGMKGYIQDWRIVVGQAVYTTDFSPPNTEFPLCG